MKAERAELNKRELFKIKGWEKPEDSKEGEDGTFECHVLLECMALHYGGVFLKLLRHIFNINSS